MKNLKRIIALVAVFAMVLTTVSFAATYTDIPADSDYYEAVETLSKLNVVTGYEDGEYKADQNVTRAEMTALIARVLGIGETAKNNMPTAFTDVPESHWASGYVSWASTSNVVKGYGNGTFGPENNVLYEEAVTMIMRALGYEVVAAAKGGYPGGFIAAAIQSGVTTDVKNAVQGTYANRGTVAQLLANAIDTPLVDQDRWNTDGTGSFIKFDGTDGGVHKTLMSEYLDVIKIKGIVKATPFANLDENNADYTAVEYEADEPEQVVIEVRDVFNTQHNEAKEWVEKDSDGEIVPTEQTFYIANSDAADYIARAVLVYVVQNEDGDWEILSIVPDSSRAAEVSFPFENIDEYDVDVIKYFKDGAEKTTKLNMVKDFEGYESLGTVPDGVRATVTVIDNNKTAGYEVALVQVIETAVVESVSKTKINFRGTNSKSLSYTDDNKKVVIVKDGVVIDATDLAENDVVAITGPENLKKVEVLTKKIEGKISGKKAVENGYAYKIDGTYYELAVGADKVGKGKFDTGFEGVIYIDKFGDVVYWEGAKVAGNIAYVLEVSDPKDGNFNDKIIEAKLLTAEGIQIYEVADKFYFDGAEDPEKLNEDYNNIRTELANSELVKFTLSNGKISKVYRADNAEVFEKDDALDTFTAYEWKASKNKLGSEKIDESAIVFSIASEDKDDSFVTTLADFVDEDNYEVKLYKTKDANDFDVVIIEDLQKVINSKTEYAIVTGVATGTNEDGEDIYELTLVYEGEENTYLTTSDVHTDNSLAVGDVIQFRATETLITSVTKAAFDVIRFTDKVAENVSDILSASDALVMGYALEVDGADITVQCGVSETKDVDFTEARRIYYVETKGRAKDELVVSEGVAGDISLEKDFLDDDEKAIDPDTALVEPTNTKVGQFYTEIIVTYNAKKDVDTIFLIAGIEDGYKMAD